MFEGLLLAQRQTLWDQYGFYILPVLGSILLSYAIFNLIREMRKTGVRKVSDRLRETSSSNQGVDRDELAAKKSILRQHKEAASIIASALSKLSLTASIQRMLDQADIQWSASTVMVNLVGFSAASFIITYFMKMELWVVSVIACSVFGLPLVVIFIKQKIRLNRFTNQLPDVFDLMGQGLRAGHSLANAILLVSQQLPDPVRGEFARVFHEQNLGLKIEDALKNMAKRVGLMDVRFFVTAVIIQRQTGGDLAEVLDKISSVVRERIKLFGMVKALTAEGRLSGWVLLGLPIVVFVLEMVINPSYAEKLLYTQTGQYMLIAGAVAQVLGLAMIQKIVNIKV